MESYESKNKEEESTGEADLQLIDTMYNLLRLQVDSTDRIRTQAAYTVIQNDKVLEYDGRTEFREISGQGGGGITNAHQRQGLGYGLKEEWSLQFGDAEAKIIATIWDWRICRKDVKRDIYIYVTKGPCQSCRQLFKNYVYIQTNSKIIVMWGAEPEIAYKNNNKFKIIYGIPDLKKTKLGNVEIYVKIYKGSGRK